MDRTARLQRVLLGVIVAVGLALSTAAVAEIYRYVDDSGEVNFVSDLSEVPPQYRQQAIDELAARQGEGGGVNILPEADQMPTDAPPSSSASDDASSQTIGGHDQAWWHGQARQKQQRVTSLAAQLQRMKDDDTTTEYEADPLAVRGDAAVHRSNADRHGAGAGPRHGAGAGPRPGAGVDRNVPAARDEGAPGHPAVRRADVADAYDDDNDDVENEGPTVEQVQQQLTAAKQDLADFANQARKAGVPPGWLR
jgi:hypothetical protein